MKKIVAMLSAAAILLSVCGCGNKANKLPADSADQSDILNEGAEPAENSPDIYEFFSTKSLEYSEYANYMLTNLNNIFSDVQAGIPLDGSTVYTNARGQLMEWCNEIDAYPAESVPEGAEKIYGHLCSVSGVTKNFFDSVNPELSENWFRNNLLHLIEKADADWSDESDLPARDQITYIYRDEKCENFSMWNTINSSADTDTQVYTELSRKKGTYGDFYYDIDGDDILDEISIWIDMGSYYEGYYAIHAYINGIPVYRYRNNQFGDDGNWFGSGNPPTISFVAACDTNTSDNSKELIIGVYGVGEIRLLPIRYDGSTAIELPSVSFYEYEESSLNDFEMTLNEGGGLTARSGNDVKVIQ